MQCVWWIQVYSTIEIEKFFEIAILVIAIATGGNWHVNVIYNICGIKWYPFHRRRKQGQGGLMSLCVCVCVCVFVCVYVFVFVCLSAPRLLITSGMMWRDMGSTWLVKQVLKLLCVYCSHYHWWVWPCTWYWNRAWLRETIHCYVILSNIF